MKNVLRFLLDSFNKKKVMPVECRAEAYRLTYGPSAYDPFHRIRVVFYANSADESVLKKAAKIAIEESNPKWALGYFVTILNNDTGELITTFLIHYKC